MEVRVKRIYDKPSKEDGARLLVDRLWPRGVSKERATLDAWLKEVAPSPELRVWFGHDPAKFNEFRQKYEAELSHNPAIGELNRLLDNHKTVTLLYGAKDPIINHAVVLRDYIQKAHIQ